MRFSPLASLVLVLLLSACGEKATDMVSISGRLSGGGLFAARLAQGEGMSVGAVTDDRTYLSTVGADGTFVILIPSKKHFVLTVFNSDNTVLVSGKSSKGELAVLDTLDGGFDLGVLDLGNFEIPGPHISDSNGPSLFDFLKGLDKDGDGNQDSGISQQGDTSPKQM